MLGPCGLICKSWKRQRRKWNEGKRVSWGVRANPPAASEFAMSALRTGVDPELV